MALFRTVLLLEPLALAATPAPSAAPKPAPILPPICLPTAPPAPPPIAAEPIRLLVVFQKVC
ncbi:hypothetical protein J558_3376 [Acinetobacter baumannii 1106579]|nr:hypothetical protein J558_3376 [Acinetobacter baumannii 1106579]